MLFIRVRATTARHWCRWRCRLCGDSFAPDEGIPTVSLCSACRHASGASPNADEPRAPADAELFYVDVVFQSPAAPRTDPDPLLDLSRRQRWNLDLYTREWLLSFAQVVSARGTPSVEQLGSHAARLIGGQFQTLTLDAEPSQPTSPPLAADAAPPEAPDALPDAPDTPPTPLSGVSRARPVSERYAQDHARILGAPSSLSGGNFWGAVVRPEERLLLATERGVWEPCYGVLSNAEWGRRFGSRTNRKVYLPRIAAIHRRQALRAGGSQRRAGGTCWVQAKRLVPFDLALLAQPVPAWIYD